MLEYGSVYFLIIHKSEQLFGSSERESDRAIYRPLPPLTPLPPLPPLPDAPSKLSSTSVGNVSENGTGILVVVQSKVEFVVIYSEKYMKYMKHSIV